MPDQIFLMSLEKFLKGKCSFGPNIFKNSRFGSSVETKIFPKGQVCLVVFTSLYVCTCISHACNFRHDNYCKGKST